MSLALLISSLQRVNNLTEKGWLKAGKEKRGEVGFSRVSNTFNDCRDVKLTFRREDRHNAEQSRLLPLQHTWL